MRKPSFNASLHFYERYHRNELKYNQQWQALLHNWIMSSYSFWATNFTCPVKRQQGSWTKASQSLCSEPADLSPEHKPLSCTRCGVVISFQDLVLESGRHGFKPSLVLTSCVINTNEPTFPTPILFTSEVRTRILNPHELLRLWIKTRNKKIGINA